MFRTLCSRSDNFFSIWPNCTSVNFWCWLRPFLSTICSDLVNVTGRHRHCPDQCPWRAHWKHQLFGH